MTDASLIAAPSAVVILIGKTYKVTCDMPFAVVGKSSEEVEETWEDARTLWLNWPVTIWAEGDEPPLARSFTMHVVPSGLGGGFAWTNCCCSVSGSGYAFSVSCRAAYAFGMRPTECRALIHVRKP